jgi:hypothetical protein
MPHPSKNSHPTFDHKQSSTNIIDGAEQLSFSTNQPQQDNTPTTAVAANQNGRGANHSQSSVRASPSHTTSKEQKQAHA